MKKPSPSEPARDKGKAPSLSKQETVAQIAEENRAYFAKLDAEKSLPQPPRFVIEPQDQRITEGEATRFTAKAEGVPKPTYQWFVVDRDNNGVILSGETHPELVVINTTLGISRYIVSASNSAGDAQSRVATLSVEAKRKLTVSSPSPAYVIPATSKTHAPYSVKSDEEIERQRKRLALDMPPNQNQLQVSGVADLEFQVREMIKSEFLKEPSTASAKIKSFSLVKEVGNKYRGFLELQTGQLIQTAGVDVVYDGRNIIWKIVDVQNAGGKSESNPFLENVAGVGGLLFFGGIACTVYFFQFYSTANPGSDYVNLERLNTRQDGIIIGVGACLVGLIVFLVCVFSMALNQRRAS